MGPLLWCQQKNEMISSSKLPPCGWLGLDIVVITGSSLGSPVGWSSLRRELNDLRLHDGVPMAGAWCCFSFSGDCVFAVNLYMTLDGLQFWACVCLLYYSLPLHVVEQGTGQEFVKWREKLVSEHLRNISAFGITQNKPLLFNNQWFHVQMYLLKA